MTKMPNRRRGEVPFPAAGENAYLQFNIDHMERLEGEIEGDYLPEVLNRIASLKPIGFVRTVFEMMLKDGDPSGFPYSGEVSLDDIKEAMLDAIYLAINGRTTAEFREEAEKAQIEVLKKKADLMRSDPELKSLLILETISTLGMSSEDMRDFAPTPSEDTPSETSSDSAE